MCLLIFDILDIAKYQGVIKDEKIFNMENLIKSIFNISSNQIAKLETVNVEENVVVHIRLKRPDYDMVCPICKSKLIGNGVKLKPINHKVFADRNMKLIYEANRYRCKGCNYTEIK